MFSRKNMEKHTQLKLETFMVFWMAEGKEYGIRIWPTDQLKFLEISNRPRVNISHVPQIQDVLHKQVVIRVWDMFFSGYDGVSLETFQVLAT